MHVEHVVSALRLACAHATALVRTTSSQQVQGCSRVCAKLQRRAACAHTNTCVLLSTPAAMSSAASKRPRDADDDDADGVHPCTAPAAPTTPSPLVAKNRSIPFLSPSLLLSCRCVRGRRREARGHTVYRKVVVAGWCGATLCPTVSSHRMPLWPFSSLCPRRAQPSCPVLVRVRRFSLSRIRPFFVWFSSAHPMA
jgi:hypothetical protein